MEADAAAAEAFQLGGRRARGAGRGRGPLRGTTLNGSQGEDGGRHRGGKPQSRTLGWTTRHGTFRESVFNGAQAPTASGQGSRAASGLDTDHSRISTVWSALTPDRATTLPEG